MLTAVRVTVYDHWGYKGHDPWLLQARLVGGVAPTLNYLDLSRGGGRGDTSLSHAPSARVCPTFCFPWPARCAIRDSQVLRPLDCLLHASWSGGGAAMPCEESLAQATTMLQRRGGGSYRTLTPPWPRAAGSLTARAEERKMVRAHLRRDTLPQPADTAEA